MMLRPRLNRYFYLGLLALTCLLVLSYFPLARIRAANLGATILPSTGKPLVNLKSSQSLKVTYAGSADAVAALQKGTANPTALAAADFNADGAVDVVAGYSTKNGGALAIFHGNPDAFAPTDQTLYGKAIVQGKVPPTFLPKASAFTLPESPDLLATGDFNGDGKKDVLVAARGGSNLYLLAGDGTGNLLAPQAVPVLGEVRALAVTPDGHLALSMDGPTGSQLAILAPGKGGFTTLATYPLPARGDSVAWGSLGGGLDVAVGAGTNVVMVYGALSANVQTETVTVPFQIQGLALGDFIWDRDGRTEISVLADDGSIHILQHGILNTTPVSPAELPARRAAIRGHHAKSTTPRNPTAAGAWTLARQLPYTGSSPSGPASPSAFNSPRLASSSTQDLMVLDAGQGQLHILDTSGKTASPSADVSFSGTPVAALVLPQKLNSDRDIVVLTSAQSAPMLVTSGASLTLNVNTTADIDSIDACTTTTTSIPSTLSLREAVCIANNSAPDTTTINVPAGTYDLANFETGELRIETAGGASGPYSLTINGTGTVADTIIQQTDGVDRIFEEDYALAGSNPVTIENVTIAGGDCTNDTTNDCGDGGGAIIAGAIAGDDLTLTNVVMTDNGANPTATTVNQDNGGAVGFETPGGMTVTNSTFSNNIASGAGGAIDFMSGNSGGSISITNSTFTNNTNIITGGAAAIQVYGGFTAAISGSTFTGNKTTETFGDGGALGVITEFTTDGDGAFTMSNSRIVGNTTGSSGGGTGLYIDDITATVNDNWWGCNAGPNQSGCDSILQDNNGTDSPYTPSNWLVLSLSANPNQIAVDATSTLTADLSHDSGGTGGFSVPNGTSAAFSAGSLGTASPTGTFASGTATSTFTAGSTGGTDTATATVDNQTVDATITILDSVTVTTSPGGLSITVDGTTYTAPQTFNWVVGSSHTLNTTSPQSGSAGSQYVWSRWSQGGTQSQTVAAPSSTTSYTANFTTQYQLTAASNPTIGGTVTPTSGNYYNSGTVVPLTATANAGYSFTNWTGNVANSTSASTNITMTAPQSVTANFSLIIVAAPTTTSVSSNNNPSFTTAPGNSVTFTATVTSNTTVNEGTVTFSDPANDFTCSGGNTVPVSNGQAACTTSFTTEGSRVITAAYNGTVNFQGSSGMLTQVANNHTVVTGNQFCNQGAITIPSTAGAATPYPSNIFVTGLGNVGSVTVSLTNISSSNIQQTDLLLVGPTGAALVPFAGVSNGASIAGLNIVLDDAASSFIPPGSPLISGTFKPTSTTGGTSLVFPAPAPSINLANYAATDGTATFTSTFQNTSANGTWALYAIDNSGNGAATIGGGWCLNITPATVPITITTSPAGLLVSVDGGAFTAAPLVESWIPFTSHTIATTSPQAGGTGIQYAFTGWSDTGAISHSIMVPSTATSYTASFNTQYQLTTAANPSNGGTVSPTSGSYYNSGTIVPLTATANSGFTFSSWTGNVASASSASTSITMNAPQSVTANFTVSGVQVMVGTSPAGLSFTVDGTAYTSTQTFTWSNGSSHTIATTTPQGISGTRYTFSNWSDGGAISHSVTAPATATSYTATFNTLYRLNTNVNPNNGGGTVAPVSGFYAPGTVVPLTATANAGFTFNSWTGNVANPADASTTITMSAPEVVTASFVQTQIKLNPTSISFGTVYLNTHHSQNVTVMNPGTGTLDISGVSLTTTEGAGASFTNLCGSTVAPGKGCTIEVTFTPTEIGGFSATLNVADNAGGSPQQVPITANVINPALSFRPSSLNFGTQTVGSSITKTITLTSTGTTALDISSIAITGADPGDFAQTNTCPSSLTSPNTCTISVTFTPTATGARSAGLTVTDNVGVGQQTLPLSGNGD
jgi:hypothetical protein